MQHPHRGGGPEQDAEHQCRRDEPTGPADEQDEGQRTGQAMPTYAAQTRGGSSGPHMSSE